MEDGRLIAFAVFISVLVAIGAMVMQRRRRAQRTGTDRVYGIASLAPETTEQARPAQRPRGVGTSGD
jgi:hypothetical protein